MIRSQVRLGLALGAVFGLWNLREYVNYEYVTGAPFKILVASVIGAGLGLVGGLLGNVVHGHRELSRR